MGNEWGREKPYEDTPLTNAERKKVAAFRKTKMKAAKAAKKNRPKRPPHESTLATKEAGDSFRREFCGQHFEKGVGLRNFGRQIFFGAGLYAATAKGILFDRLHEALGLMSGLQQPGGDEDERNEGWLRVRATAADVVAALLGEDYEVVKKTEKTFSCTRQVRRHYEADEEDIFNIDDAADKEDTEAIVRRVMEAVRRRSPKGAVKPLPKRARR